MRIVEWLAGRARVGTIGRPSPGIVWTLGRVMRPYVDAFYRPTVEGFENLPASGPYILVANHSGGVAMAEIWSFAVRYWERFGVDRPLAGFAHPVAFWVWPISWMMRGLGAVPSSYAWAEKALASGIPLLVFPGGDLEATRPIWKASTVDFGGRVGFLKLARRAGVPIVPMGIRGSHYTAPIMWQVRGPLRWVFGLAGWFGVKRYPVTLLGIAGAAVIIHAFPHFGMWRFVLAWAWLVSPFPLLPWVPWTIRARIGAPLEDLPEDLAIALAHVEACVRDLSR